MKLNTKLTELPLELTEVLDTNALIRLLGNENATVADYYDAFTWLTGDRYEFSQLYIEINKGADHVSN